jgi:hypothetical protein
MVLQQIHSRGFCWKYGDSKGTYFIQRFELGNGLHRPKNLFVEDLHAFFHVSENGGLDVVALGSQTGSTCMQTKLLFPCQITIHGKSKELV